MQYFFPSNHKANTLTDRILASKSQGTSKLSLADRKNHYEVEL
jgi:hypothetical protein